MNALLLVLFLALSVGSVNGQCSYVWVVKDQQAILPCIKQSVKVGEIPATCSKTFPKKFVDSVIKNVTDSPLVYPRGRNNPGVTSDFRIYKYDTIEFVHYNSQRIFFEGDTIIIHDLSFNGYSSEWNEDGCYHFLYSSQFGIIERFHFDEEGLTEYAYIKSNSCFTAGKNKRLQQLVKVRNGGVK